MYEYNKIQKRIREAEVKGERVPSDYEVAKELGIDDNRAVEIIEASKRIILSIDENLVDDNVATVIDFVPTPGPSVEECVISKFNLQELE